VSPFLRSSAPLRLCFCLCIFAEARDGCLRSFVPIHWRLRSLPCLLDAKHFFFSSLFLLTGSSFPLLPPQPFVGSHFAPGWASIILVLPPSPLVPFFHFFCCGSNLVLLSVHPSCRRFPKAEHSLLRSISRRWWNPRF